MYKLFTIEEATRLIPVVDDLVADVQTAVHDMLALRDRVQELPETSLEARNAAEEVRFLLAVIHERKADLDRLGVHLQDVETGLVDFPSRLGAEVVCLTWSRGQDAITEYHRLNGDTRQRPLPDPVHDDLDGASA